MHTWHMHIYDIIYIYDNKKKFNEKQCCVLHSQGLFFDLIKWFFLRYATNDNCLLMVKHMNMGPHLCIHNYHRNICKRLDTRNKSNHQDIYHMHNIQSKHPH